MSASELSKVDVSGVSVSKDGVSKSWNDLTFVQGSVSEFPDSLLADVVSELLLKIQQPSQAFLVGKTVERSGETVETGGVGEVGVGEGGADQVGGVGGDVTTFVVGVDAEVSSDALLHFELAEA